MKKHTIPLIVLTNACQAAMLMGIGDICAQTVVEKKPVKNLNFKRTFHFAMVGAVFIGPSTSMWYITLSKLFPKGGKICCVKKMLLDQIIFAPAFLLLVTCVLWKWDGKSYEEIKRHLNAKYWEILFTNWKVWPAAQLINFYYIPVRHQVVYVQTLSIFWNTYLSFMTSKEI